MSRRRLNSVHVWLKTQMRRAKKQYKYRNTQPPEETLRIFSEMLAGSEEGKRWCLRAKCVVGCIGFCGAGQRERAFLASAPSRANAGARAPGLHASRSLQGFGGGNGHFARHEVRRAAWPFCPACGTPQHICHTGGVKREAFCSNIVNSVSLLEIE